MKRLSALLLLVSFALPSIALAAPALRIACVGDSITAGYGVEGNASYPSQLAGMVGPEFQQIRNFGYSGTTLLTKGDSPYGTESSYQAVVDYQPDIVLLMLGTNDSKPHNWVKKDEFLADYHTMVTRFRALRSRPTVIAMLPIPGVGDGAFQIPPIVVKKEVLPAVRAAATADHVPLIDTNTPFIGRPELIADNIHPNPAGYKLIAETVAKSLKQLPRFSTTSEPFLTTAEAIIEIPAGADVRYTLDGTLPTAKSKQYTKPITVEETTVITAAIFEAGKSGLASSLTLTKETPHAALPAAKTEAGLNYVLYQGTPGQIWRIAVDENLKVGEGIVSSITLEPRKQEEWYAITYTGRITVPKSGMYRFFLNSRQGTRLIINGGLVIENADNPSERSGAVALAAGSHEFKLHYYDIFGEGRLKLEWEGPELAREVVPDSAFSH